jgi:hypothetical protein
MSRGTVPTRKITVTPVITTAPYTSGDALGGKITFDEAVPIAGSGGLILSGVLASKAAFVATDLFLFDSDFSATADNAAFALAVADIGNLIGVIPFTAGVAGGTPSVSTVQNASLGFQAKGTKVYGQLVVRGTPTYAVGDINVSIVLRPDAH